MGRRISRYTVIGIVAGCLLSGGLAFILSNPKFLAQFRHDSAKNTKATPTPQRRRDPPTAINIPKINRNLPIKPAEVHDNTWDLFSDAVAWLSTSAAPGDGNVILYAHDWVPLWADLVLLKPGDDIEVEQGNVWKKYKVTTSKAVDQHDVTSILSNSQRLTMYTCEGSFDQKRRVVYAAPVD